MLSLLFMYNLGQSLVGICLPEWSLCSLSYPAISLVLPTDSRVSELKPFHAATYLFTRIKQLGIDFIHGVPGDYNLVALDYVPLCDLEWVGNCNELNAGYAADGYARVKGISAVVTTFGVGELSLLNAIAGANDEYVPTIHVAGIPSTISQRAGVMMPRTLATATLMSSRICQQTSHYPSRNWMILVRRQLRSITHCENATSRVDQFIPHCQQT